MERRLVAVSHAAPILAVRSSVASPLGETLGGQSMRSDIVELPQESGANPRRPAGCQLLVENGADQTYRIFLPTFAVLNVNLPVRASSYSVEKVA